MIRLFFRQRLMLQFSLLMLALTLAVGALFLTVRHSLIEVQALQRGRTVANMVDAFGAWASQYKGIWVRSDPGDPTLKVGDFLEHRIASRPDAASAPSPVSPASSAAFSTKGLSAHEIAAIANSGAFHSKNPALVQRELSQVVSQSESVEKFRITSDRFFNASNAPTRFELTAIETIRDSAGQVDEYFEVRNNTLLYARKLIAKPACMRCHDTPEKSPVAVQSKYAGTAGWGYTSGGVAGIISVTIPMSERDLSAVLVGLSPATKAAAIAVIVVLLMLLYWLHRSVIGAAYKMEAYSNKVKSAQRGETIDKIMLDGEEITSSNEMHRLSHALKAIARALTLAQKDK